MIGHLLPIYSSLKNELGAAHALKVTIDSEAVVSGGARWSCWCGGRDLNPGNGLGRPVS